MCQLFSISSLITVKTQKHFTELGKTVIAKYITQEVLLGNPNKLNIHDYWFRGFPNIRTRSMNTNNVFLLIISTKKFIKKI